MAKKKQTGRPAAGTAPHSAPERIAALLQQAADAGRLAPSDLDLAMDKLGLRRAASRQSQTRRQDILDAASEVFAARGYNAATLQDIADQLGLTRQAFYYYFRSKQEILDAIAMATAEATDAVVEEALRLPASGSGEAFAQVLHRYAFHIAGQRATGIMMRHYDDMSPEVQRELAERRRRREGRVLDLLRRAIRAKALSSPEPRVALKCAFEAIHATYNWYRQDGPLSREAVVRVMVHHILHGFCGA
jgi:AcrR family transcriptional regulator